MRIFVFLIFFFTPFNAAVFSINKNSYTIPQELITLIANCNIKTLFTLRLTSSAILKASDNSPLFKALSDIATRRKLCRDILDEKIKYTDLKPFFSPKTYENVRDVYLKNLHESLLKHAKREKIRTDSKENKGRSYSLLDQLEKKETKSAIRYYFPSYTHTQKYIVMMKNNSINRDLCSSKDVCRIIFSGTSFDEEFVKMLLRMYGEKTLNAHIIFEDKNEKSVIQYIVENELVAKKWFNDIDAIDIFLSVSNPFRLCELILNKKLYRLLKRCLKNNIFSNFDFFHMLIKNFREITYSDLYEFLTILLEHGLNPNLIYSNNYQDFCNKKTSVLYSLCAAGLNAHGIALLLQHGADLNLYKKDERLPILWKALFNRKKMFQDDHTYELCQFFLEKGILPNDQDNNGKSALHFLPKFSCRFFKLLLTFGANLLLKNKKDKTPLKCIKNIQSTRTIKKMAELFVEYKYSVSFPENNKITISKNDKEVTIPLNGKIDISLF